MGFGSQPWWANNLKHTGRKDGIGVMDVNEVLQEEFAWIRWNTGATNSFWHQLERNDRGEVATLCGFLVPYENSPVEVLTEHPHSDECGFCIRLARGDDAVFDTPNGKPGGDRRRGERQYGEGNRGGDNGEYGGIRNSRHKPRQNRVIA